MSVYTDNARANCSMFHLTQRLYKKHRSLKPDLADLALVHIAHREDLQTIFTLERRDFSVYRDGQGKPFRLIP
jgi:hypothetical protein